MLIIKSRKFISLLLIISIPSIYALSNVNASQPLSTKNNSTMIAKSNVLVKITNLIARQENTPPLGKPPQPNRDIGFASVFLSLQNPTAKNQTIIIKSVKISNISDGKLQSFSFKSRNIELKPLENSEIALHLTNKTGYSGKDQVKAIVTYQINKKVKTIASEAVVVDKQ